MSLYKGELAVARVISILSALLERALDQLLSKLIDPTAGWLMCFKISAKSYFCGSPLKAMGSASRRAVFLSHLLLIAMFVSGCGVVGFGAHRGAPGQAVYYEVQAGDTLYEIARRYRTTIAQIARLNGVRNANSIAAGQLLLVRYSSGSSSFKWFWEKDDPAPQYQGGTLAWPTAGGRIASTFGKRWGRMHEGVDIAAPIGTPIFAAHSGKVVYADDKLRGYGKLVIIKDVSQSFTTVYAHNRRFYVREGDNVQRGEKIAEIGMTGRTTGPHLHFEVRARDKSNRFVAVDPMPYLRNRRQ